MFATGDEGDHVGGSDAGMNAALAREVDEMSGFARRENRRFDDCRGSSSYGHNGPVVVLIARMIE